jgi:hypothetical protein
LENVEVLVYQDARRCVAADQDPIGLLLEVDSRRPRGPLLPRRQRCPLHVRHREGDVLPGGRHLLGIDAVDTLFQLEKAALVADRLATPQDQVPRHIQGVMKRRQHL